MSWRFLQSGGLADRDLGPVETVVVTSEPFDHIVLEQGELESSNNLEVKCEVPSEGAAGITILWIVPEGTFVSEGDKLLELDGAALEEALKNQRILVANRKADVIKAEADVKAAEISLRQYLEGEYVFQRKTLLGEIALAEQAVRNAELSLQGAKMLNAKGAASELQVESEEFAVANAKKELDLAILQLKTLDELVREKNRIQLEGNIEAAKAQLSAQRSSLSETQDRMNELQSYLDKCEIFAPAPGVVVYNNVNRPRRGENFVVEEGAIVRDQQVIIKLPDPSAMRVRATINESRILGVSEGLPASIRVIGVPGEMRGRVSRVNRYADPGNWYNSAVKEYSTWVEIFDPPEAVRTGMTAEIQILADQLPQALTVPVESIYEHHDRLFCMRRKGNDWETVEIEIFATNQTVAAVTSGLSAEDEIARNPHEHLDLMDLPVIAEVENREALVEIGQLSDADRSSE